VARGFNLKKDANVFLLYQPIEKLEKKSAG
jgi:hypothetical protein